MKALINPLQDNFVVETNENEFEVSQPLYWQSCTDEILAYQYQYVDGQFIEYVVPEPVAPPEPTKSELLAQLAELTAKIEALGE